MQDLLILGTGVHAAEMAEITDRINKVQLTWNLLGYVSQDGTGEGEMLNGYPVLGGMDVLTKYPDASLVPDNNWKQFDNISRNRFNTLIDPSAFVSRTAKIGRGSVIYPHCYIGLNAHIHDFVFCLSGCIINHDDWIGERVIIASSATLAGNVRIADHCYLGQSCSIRQFVEIGARCLIGMGSIVLNNIPADSIIVGNPGRKLRDSMQDL